MSAPELNVKDVGDVVVRRNFQNMKDYFAQQGGQLDQFVFMELVFSKAATNQKVAHGLGFVPQDFILTRLTGANLTLNWGLFDKNYLDISVSGPCRVRFFVGAKSQGQSQGASTDTQTYKPA